MINNEKSMKFIKFYTKIVKNQETDADDMPPPARGCLLKAGGGHWNQFPGFKIANNLSIVAVSYP